MASAVSSGKPATCVRLFLRKRGSPRIGACGWTKIATPSAAAASQTGARLAIVEIVAADIGADLHRGEAQHGGHALQLLHGQVGRLQRQPARAEEARGAPADQLRDRVVLHPAPLGRGGAGRPVAEGGRGGGEELAIHAGLVHLLEPARGVEGVRRQVAVERRAQVELAPGGRVALEPRPAVAAVARREVRPAAREDVRVDVDRSGHAPPARLAQPLQQPDQPPRVLMAVREQIRAQPCPLRRRPSRRRGRAGAASSRLAVSPSAIASPR